MVNHFRGVMRQQQSSSLFYRNRRYRNTRGAAGIEYCLLLALFAVAIIPATQALRFEIENTLIPYQTDGGTDGGRYWVGGGSNGTRKCITGIRRCDGRGGYQNN